MSKHVLNTRLAGAVREGDRECARWDAAELQEQGPATARAAATTGGRSNELLAAERRCALPVHRR